VGSSGTGDPPVGSSSTGDPPVGSSGTGDPPVGSSGTGDPPVGSSSTGDPPVLHAHKPMRRPSTWASRPCHSTLDPNQFHGRVARATRPNCGIGFHIFIKNLLTPFHYCATHAMFFSQQDPQQNQSPAPPLQILFRPGLANPRLKLIPTVNRKP